jgi:hypothetical protein
VDQCRCNTQAQKTIGNAMPQCRPFYMGATIPANNRQKMAHKPAADCLNMGDKTHMPTIEKGKQ